MKNIYGIIRRLGINSTYKGYFFVADAIALAMDSQEKPIKITKEIYPSLAAKFKTNTLNIEHNIRTVINVCWETNRDGLNEIAGFPLVNKPTNSEFIDILAYYLSSSEEGLFVVFCRYLSNFCKRKFDIYIDFTYLDVV